VTGERIAEMYLWTVSSRVNSVRVLRVLRVLRVAVRMRCLGVVHSTALVSKKTCIDYGQFYAATSYA